MGHSLFKLPSVTAFTSCISASSLGPALAAHSFILQCSSFEGVKNCSAGKHGTNCFIFTLRSFQEMRADEFCFQTMRSGLTEAHRLHPANGCDMVPEGSRALLCLVRGLWIMSTTCPEVGWITTCSVPLNKRTLYLWNLFSQPRLQNTWSTGVLTFTNCVSTLRYLNS